MKQQVAAIVGLVVMLGGCSSAGAGEPGESLALRACGDARAALREAGEGTRTVASAVDALAGASDRARSAVTLNEKWRPVAESIVAAHGELQRMAPGDGVERVAANCGMPG